MKFFLLCAAIIACANYVVEVSGETCEQMIDNFSLPDFGKPEGKAWIKSQVQKDDEPDCLDEIIDMMIKGMEGEKRKRDVAKPFNLWGNSQAVSNMLSGPFEVSTINGQTEYKIDGKKIDLSRAKILKDDKDAKILDPVEVKGAKVTVYKNDKRITLDYKGKRMDTLTDDGSSYMISNK